jgi:hypothetical protein
MAGNRPAQFGAPVKESTRRSAELIRSGAVVFDP